MGDDKLLEIVKSRLAIFKNLRYEEKKAYKEGKLEENTLMKTDARISELEQILFSYEVKCESDLLLDMLNNSCNFK